MIDPSVHFHMGIPVKLTIDCLVGMGMNQLMNCSSLILASLWFVNYVHNKEPLQTSINFMVIHGGS